MRLWDILVSNPLILLLIGGYVLSNLGGWLQRVVAQRQRQRDQQARALAPDSSWQGRGTEVAAVETAAEQRAARRESAAQSREELAAKMRQLMGIESAPTTVAEREAVQDFVIESVEPAASEGSERRTHGVRGGLEEEMARRDAEGRVHKRTSVEQREFEREEQVRDRHLPEHHSRLESADGAKPWGSRRRKSGRARHLFDRKDMARAIVAREILDAPRGVRGWDA